MIVYELGCGNDHRFEGWFDSSDDFERQLRETLLTCPLCGNGKITRLPHAPYVNTGAVEVAARAAPAAKSSQYANLDAEMVAKLVDHIIENTEDVGPDFPEEARKIHYSEAPERRIRGTATTREVAALMEEGIEVASLPIPIHRMTKPH